MNSVFSTFLLLGACVSLILGGGIAAKYLALDIRNDVAPLITAASVAAAVVLFYLKERSDKRRKTLEASEKLLYDPGLRQAYSTIATVLQDGKYEPDTAEAKVGSHRDLTSLLLNYLETCCTGVVAGFYERKLIHDLLGPLAKLLITNFLVRPADAGQNASRLPTSKFLPVSDGFMNMRDVFGDLFLAAVEQPPVDDAALVPEMISYNAGGTMSSDRIP